MSNLTEFVRGDVMPVQTWSYVQQPGQFKFKEANPPDIRGTLFAIRCFISQRK
jgi:hypothetical protein